MGKGGSDRRRVAAELFRGGGSIAEAYRTLQHEASGNVEVGAYEWMPKTPDQLSKQAGRARSLGAKCILFWEGDYLDGENRTGVFSGMSAQTVPANWREKER